MEDCDNQTARQAARDGRIVSVSADTTGGTNITGRDGREFNNTNDANQWTLADDVSRTRQFRIEVSKSTALAKPDGEEFRVVADGGVDEWVLILSDTSEATVRWSVRPVTGR